MRLTASGLATVQTGLLKALVIFTLGLTISTNALANTAWDWSFAGESGQFITDGDGLLEAGQPAAGTYLLQDFIVTSSSAGAALGSSGDTLSSFLGDYAVVHPYAPPPYSFLWDGSQVTAWLNSRADSGDFWFISDTADTRYSYVFGADAEGLFDTSQATYVIVDSPGQAPSEYLAQGSIVVSASSVVPIPAAVWLFGSALTGLGWLGRRKIV
jgi:hypothetical protein